MELELGLQLLVQALPALAQIFAALQEERLSILKHEQTKELQKIKPLEDSGLPHENRDIQKWGFEQEKSLQQEIAAYNRETLLKLADSGREIALKFQENQKINDNWPLKLLPSQFLASRNSDQLLPLRIFLAPLKVQGDLSPTIADIELSLAQGLREFLSQHYPLDSQKRPTEFLAGAWKNKHFNREASIKALFEMLKSEPSLILESEIVGDYLNFRIAYWGLGQKTYCYKTIISKLSYWEIVYASAKKRALKWKETANKLLACGESIEEVNRLGGDNVANLQILEKEEKWQQLGIDCSELDLKYKVNSKDFAALSEFLITYHCLIASWVADAHHLINGEVPPLLPELLPDLTRDISQDRAQALMRSSISGYRDIFNLLESEHPIKVSELALKLARSLAVLPDKYWAKELVEYSIKVWLKQRQLPDNGGDILEAIQSFIGVEDKKYLENLKDCLITVGDEFCLAQVCRLLSVLEDLQSKTILENASITPKKDENSIIQIGSNLSAIAKFKRNFQPENVSIIHTLTGHSGKASSIAVSLDGSTIASGSDDNTIKLWHLGTGELLHTFNANSGRVLAINLSPDGEILASSHRTSDRSCIKIWQLQTGELLHTLTGHNKWIYSLAISPDAQTLVSGSHKIKTWHLGTGEPLHTLAGHKKWVYSLAISPDGQKFVSSGGDKIIKIWHLHSGELIRTLEGHLDWIRSVVISPNGEILASGSDDNTIKIWDLNSGRLFHTLTGHSDWVLSLAITPDGQTLISGGKDHTIKLWHLETGKLLGTLKGHKKWVYSLAISPDGQTFASGSEDKTINIWRAV